MVMCCLVANDCLCCAWCQKVGNSKDFSLKTPNGNKVFCSEQCFTQCRRASFKRNKTCDWCRHVRHTVNYVDFQDGDHQLQFCRYVAILIYTFGVKIRSVTWMLLNKINTRINLIV